MKSVGIPLILTFKLDKVSQVKLDHWRQTHFPAERNYLKAHLTIYHQLPGQQIDSIRDSLRELANIRKPVPLLFDRLSTRQGFVGIGVSSVDMLSIKSDLNAMFGSLLRAQDKQPYRPHVTVTNKGSPRDAEKVFAILEREFEPWTGEIIGLELYHYRGGPWELAEVFLFDAP